MEFVTGVKPDSNFLDQLKNGKISVNSSMLLGRNYVNLVSERFQSAALGPTSDLTKDDKDFNHWTSLANPRKRVREFDDRTSEDNQFDYEMFQKFNELILNPTEKLVAGHLVDRDCGGSDLKSNLIPQSGRSNCGITCIAEGFIDLLFDMGFDTVSFFCGVLYKDQINNAYLSTENADWEKVAFGDGKSVPIGCYSDYLARKDGLYYLYCFVWPYFGLPVLPLVRGKVSSWDVLKNFAVHPDFLAKLIGFRFLNAELKAKISFVNQFDSDPVQYMSETIVFPNPNFKNEE